MRCHGVFCVVFFVTVFALYGVRARHLAKDGPNLLSWAKQNGADFEKLDFRLSEDGNDVACVATSDITKGEVFAQLPVHLFLCHHIAEEAFGPETIAHLEGVEDGKFASLALALLVERWRGKDSLHHEYIG